jgi:hypothetical protein
MSKERRILELKLKRLERRNTFLKIYEKVLDGIDTIQGRKII